ncbi:MAG TPA: cytochrome c3 family protein [Opitutaceae bacterium]
MNLFPTRTKRRIAVIVGAAWAALFISCVAIERTLVVPPTVAGAEFVGSGECAQCHDNITSGFHDATHARLSAAPPHGTDIGCEACHGPGSVHVRGGGEAGTIVNPARSPEACFQCHLDKRGEFHLPHGHPLLAGEMTCTDCHDPHRGESVLGGGTQLASANETCLRCHQAQRGPFVFAHEAVQEGCVTCHNPHGSVNEKMLKARNQALCLQCHFQQQAGAGQLLIGGVNHQPFVTRGTCWTAGCHEAVHGSHASSSLRF